MQLTNNFNLEEFVTGDRFLSPVQIFLLQNLCVNILQPLRDFVKCNFKIINGVRFPSDLNKLKKQGYNPSETSDHFFGNGVRLRNKNKKKKFGLYHFCSVGAVDFIPATNVKEFFSLLIKTYYFENSPNKLSLPKQVIEFGQLILETNSNKSWIHISNPPSLVYNTIFIEKYLKKPPLLVSTNNGFTYKAP